MLIRTECNKVNFIDQETFYSKVHIKTKEVEFIFVGNFPNQLVNFKSWTASIIEKSDLTIEKIRQFFLGTPWIISIIITFKSKNTLHLITDPFGIIKFYFIEEPSFICITDNYQQLKGQVPLFTIDKNSIKYFWLHNSTPSKHTFFEEINKMPPASLISIFNNKIEKTSYLKVEKPKNGSIANAKNIEKIFNLNLERFLKTKNKYMLFFSGGIDSSVLLNKLVEENKEAIEVKTTTGKILLDEEWHQNINHEDVEFSKKIAEDLGSYHTTVFSNLKRNELLDEFLELRKMLFCEYHFNVNYSSFVSQVEEDIIVNGQNADSILSFGFTGNPKLNQFNLEGIGQLFLKANAFWGYDKLNNPIRVIIKFLRKKYYSQKYNLAAPDFNKEEFLRGFFLHPTKLPLWKEDPAYKDIKLDTLEKWVDDNYINEITKVTKDGNFLQFSELSYLNTFMQGADNRGTLLAAVYHKKVMFFPFISLAMLEEMLVLNPDWRNIYWGKYPNMRMLMRYNNYKEITTRKESPEALSNLFKGVESGIFQNKKFISFLSDNLKLLDSNRYKSIFKDSVIKKMKDLKRNGLTAKDVSFYLKVFWIDSLVREFKAEPAELEEYNE